MKSFTRKLLAASFAAFGGAVACVPAGIEPADQIYFPVSMLVDEASRFLYVVNSDFDLKFNQGTVQSLDLQRVREVARRPCNADAQCPESQHCDLAPTPENDGAASRVCVDDSGPYANKPCGPFPEMTSAERALSPGRCGAVLPSDPQDEGSSLIVDVVGISAFATTGMLLSGPDGQERLFVPVRGDSTLHYIDVADGRFACGQNAGEEELGRCDESYKIAEAPDWVQEIQPLPHEDDLDQSVEPLRVAPEPYELAASANGRLLLMTHQVGGTASAFVNDWSAKPFLVANLQGLPPNPMGIAALPPPAIARLPEQEYSAGFLMTSRSSSTIRLLRFYDDGMFGTEPFAPSQELQAPDTSSRPVLREVGSQLITANSGGFDSRGILVDDTERALAEAKCEEGDADCLAGAAEVPLDVYVANRSPNSLLVGSTDARSAPIAAAELPTFHQNIPLTQGPSRVILGHVTTAAGERERRVFVLCFDSDIIYVYDPNSGQIEGEIVTGRGPHSLAFDGERPLLYVGHFTDSYVGVISLDQRYPHTYGSMLATIGVPTAPRAAK